MKDGLKLLLVAIIVAVVTAVSQYMLYSCNGILSGDNHDLPECDTLILHDTLIIPAPEPVATARLPPVTVRLPKAEHTGDSVMPSDSVPDSCTPADSADVIVPMERKVFTDSVNYRAVVSGYNVTLDTMALLRTREYVTVRTKPPDKRFAIGPAVGVGWDGRCFSPYVGVTLTFAIWQF